MSTSEEYVVKKAWKIGDFSKLFEKHQNTVDNWFKELERRGIHYVNRSESGKEKIYDEEDYKIAVYINGKRDEKWTIDAIIDSLPHVNTVTLRGENQHSPQTSEDVIERLKLFQIELESRIINASREAAQEELRNHTNSQIKLLEEDRTYHLLKRKEDILTQHKLRFRLRGEAEIEWSKIPILNKLFKNKEEFIRKYEETHFEDKLNEEFDYKQDNKEDKSL